MSKKISLACLVFIVFMALFIKPSFVFAQGVEFQNNSDVGITLDDKLVLKDGSLVKDVFNSTDDMVNLLVDVIFVGSGMVLFAMMVGAGFAMISSSSSEKDKSKTTMTNALIGFVIMFAAYWILQIIQLLTGTSLGF